MDLDHMNTFETREMCVMLCAGYFLGRLFPGHGSATVMPIVPKLSEVSLGCRELHEIGRAVRGTAAPELH